MTNRRQTYRHSFSTEDSFCVELALFTARKSVRAELVNISSGGMRVRCHKSELPLQVHEQLRISLQGPVSASPLSSLTLLADVAYVESDGELICCGIRFVDSLHPAANQQRDAALRRFLMEEQRRALRQARIPSEQST